jgi:hypothetical protein
MRCFVSGMISETMVCGWMFVGGMFFVWDVMLVGSFVDGTVCW